MSGVNATIAKYRHCHPADLIDFQGDARLYMELFEEMAKTELLLTLRHYRPTNLWLVEFYNETATIVTLRIESNDKGSSICLAYIKLHGLECEG